MKIRIVGVREMTRTYDVGQIEDPNVSYGDALVTLQCSLYSLITAAFECPLVELGFLLRMAAVIDLARSSCTRRRQLMSS